MGKGTSLNKENKRGNYRTTGVRKNTVNKNMRKCNRFSLFFFIFLKLYLMVDSKTIILYYVIPNEYTGNSKTNWGR